MVVVESVSSWDAAPRECSPPSQSPTRNRLQSGGVTTTLSPGGFRGPTSVRHSRLGRLHKNSGDSYARMTSPAATRSRSSLHPLGRASAARDVRALCMSAVEYQSCCHVRTVAS